MKCIFLIYFCIILHFLFTNEGFQTRILRTKSEVFSMCQQQYDITYEDLNPVFLYTTHGIRRSSEQPHSHDFPEIAVILDGTGEFCVDGSTLPVKKGDLLLFNPGVMHQSRHISDSHQAAEFYTAFTNLRFRDMDENQNCFPGKPVLLHPKEKVFLQISRLAEAMMVEACHTELGRYFMLKSYLTQLILLLYREQTGSASAAGTGYYFESNNKKYIVEQVVDYFERHFSEKISLDQIARNMYLSPFYISRLFKNEVGDTPINYLISLRMKEAEQLLLAQPDASVQDIAKSVGYEDAYHFSKVFKKHFGISPSNFRKSREKV